MAMVLVFLKFIGILQGFEVTHDILSFLNGSTNVKDINYTYLVLNHILGLYEDFKQAMLQHHNNLFAAHIVFSHWVAPPPSII